MYKNIISIFLCTSGNPHPMSQEWNYGYINKIANEREFIDLKITLKPSYVMAFGVLLLISYFCKFFLGPN
jgi:hypothetical protein